MNPYDENERLLITHTPQLDNDCWIPFIQLEHRFLYLYILPVSLLRVPGSCQAISRIKPAAPIDSADRITFKHDRSAMCIYFPLVHHGYLKVNRWHEKLCQS